MCTYAFLKESALLNLIQANTDNSKDTTQELLGELSISSQQTSDHED